MSSPNIVSQARDLFEASFGGAPAVCSAAPGRIEFIGNHTDYNGGPVLGAAIDLGIAVALRLRNDGRKSFVTTGNPHRVVSEDSEKPTRREGQDSWVNYPLGVWLALSSFGLRAPHGFEMAVASDLPVGAGLSSSAALELATGLALISSTGQSIDTAKLAALGRKAENDFVGLPCGILDQGTSAFGRAGHLVHIDCRGPVFSSLAMPQGPRFWIFNTHTKHSLVDSLYSTRHRECQDAARLLGVAHLADISSAELEKNAAKLTPVLLQRARHIVGECERVGAVQAACQSGDAAAIGRLLRESHQSSRVNFENSTPELDFLAEKLSAHPRIHGARLTGGGFGGAVMALAAADFSQADARTISDAYLNHYGQAPDVIACNTGDGARLVS